MKTAAKTDKGKIRNNNEDYYYIDEKNNIFIVADGIGGHKAGEVASSLTTQLISEYIESKYNFYESKIPLLISESIKHANNVVYNMSNEKEECDGMGTTISMGILINNILYVGHVGDSRIYLLRGDSITQITKDHTLVNELLNNGTLTEEEAKNYPNKNIITKAIGTSFKVDSDIFEYEVEDGDIYIFCTDGLSDNVSKSELKEIVKENENINIMSEKLIKLANENGGSDNITVLLLSI